ncbi:hypothetical protein AB0E04_42125 [Streptomyces sp. NPDC048251]|uniref:hypothetical protein n=1 Tax=Streptomyces sp. NPDC048251 TaxID=3154501 RepID=UPI00343A1336
MANSHALAAAEAAPGQLLRQAKRLLDQAQKLVDQAVIAERMKDTSWETIGEVLGGVTKSAAQKRFGPRVKDWGDNPRRLAALGNIGLPKRELDFGVAYAQLEDEWKAAGEIVAAQDLLAELTNATTALSGANAHGEGPNAEWHGDHIFVYANSDRSPAVPLPSWVHLSEDREEARRQAGAYLRHKTATELRPERRCPKCSADQHFRPLELEERLTVVEEKLERLLAKESGEKRTPPAPGS